MFNTDAAGRITSQTDRNLDTITTSYTSSGKLGQITYPGNSNVDFVYDSRDKLTGMTDPTGTTSNTYDAAGRLTGHTDPNGFSVQYQYDAAGNLTLLTYPGAKTVSYTYDSLNRLETVSADWLSKTATYHYDNAGRLTQLSQSIGTQPLYSYQYSLDANGNRTQAVVTELKLPEKLINQDLNYSYNPQKNQLTNTQLNGTTNTVYSYDNEGQLKAQGGTAYAYDYAHRLISQGTSSYVYDGVGNRIQATRNGIVTKYIYDATGNLLAEANASQQAVNTYAYDPYGKIMAQQETVPQPFKYAGQVGIIDEGNNLYYMRARYYDANIGRFISEDPAGFAGGLNLYAYVGGNPVMLVDPDGNIPLLAIIPATGGLISGGFNAYDAYQNNKNVFTAFGTGFVSGATGTLAGMGATAVTGNPYIGGAAGGAVGNLVDTGLSGGQFSTINFGTSVVSGSVLGPLASRIIPTVGRLPNLFTSRNSSNFGPNSARLVGQEGFSGLVGGIIGAISNSFSGK